MAGRMGEDHQRIVDLNVGGVLYTTSVETLTKVRQISWREDLLISS